MQVVQEYNDEGDAQSGSEAEEDRMDSNDKYEERVKTNLEKDEIGEILGTKKKVAVKKRDENERKSIAMTFIDDMQAAADKDEKAQQREQPAVHKLKLLSKIKQVMVKKEIIGILMDNDVLGVLKRYLEPVDDRGTLPNHNIREGVLDILLSPEVATITEVWQLQKSRIGEGVMRLKDHKEETKVNRRKAAKLVELWYRMLTGTSENMKDLAKIEEDRAQSVSAPKRKKRKGMSAADVSERKQGVEGSWMQVHIPRQEAMDYTKRPKTSNDVQIKDLHVVKSKKEEEKSRVERMADKVKKTKGKLTKKGNVQAENISIEGRGMEKFI